LFISVSESTGIVSSVATPLAQAKICLFYVSTFSTGYTLVEEHSLESAVECLKAAGFTFSNERDIEFTNLRSPKNNTRHPPHIYSLSPKLNSTQMVISKLPHQLYMATLGKKDVGPLAEKLIKLVFYPEKSHRFFSFTETPDEISVILDVASAQNFPHLTLCDRIWSALQICEGSFGSHGSDTINKFAKPLADACISIFNVSTYSNDYTLIEEHNVEKSLLELRKKLNIILDEEEIDEPDS